MLLFDWLPQDSPLNDPLIKYGFCGSLLVQHALFHVISNTVLAGEEAAQLKKRAWILTTFNSIVTSLAALPFLYDLFLSGFDLHAIRSRTPLTHITCAFFVAYLLSDLGLGSIYYRKMINLSSGWIHHTVYTFLFIFWVHKRWGHIVVSACIFELPTFIMGIASIHPPLRNNMAFTVSFFVTRVFLHIALLCSAATQHGRAAPTIEGSVGPLISLTVTLPMHLWWGYKCILSVRRRMRKRRIAAQAEREKQGNALANVTGQVFNGFGAPDMHSAVNTPLPTPGLNANGVAMATSHFSQSAPVALHAAFAKAAAASRRPMDLVLNRTSKRDSSSSSSSIATYTVDAEIYNDQPVSSVSTRLQAPVTIEANRTRSRCSSFKVPRDSSFRPSSELSRMASLPLTVPIPPEGAGPDAREPFLAIRSAAEGRDRAHRLVADTVRKVWYGAPESWRRQFEDEAQAMDAVRQQRPRRAPNSLVDPSDTEVNEDEGYSDDGAVQAARARSRAYRARALLRRGVLCAIRSAINGRDVPASSSSSEREPGDRDDLMAAQASAVARSLERKEGSVDFSHVLKLSGLPFPPEWTGEEYEVRPLEVERRREGQSARDRLVADVRRRMEVRARNVVIWD